MTTRVEDAITIRDHVVSLARSDGIWKVDGGLPELVWERARWVARFSSPAELAGNAKSGRGAPNRLLITDGGRVLFRAGVGGRWSDPGNDF